MKSISVKYVFIIALMLGSLNGIAQVVKVYPYYVNPTEYPDYSRRPFKTPTWDTFNDTVQFVGGRVWGNKFGHIDGKAPNWISGAKVLRPNHADFLMTEDSLRVSLTEMKNEYLFNINAYGPGTPASPSFGQFKLDKWKINMMRDILEDRYMGFDLGEQDGRYWAVFRSVDFAVSFNYQERYLKAMEFMHRAAIDQGDILSMLSVKWFWHYPIKDGFITISGAESQSKTYTSNDQIHYAFIRGASKQYGTLWYGDISVFNSWGWKAYGDEPNKKNGPTKGNSVSWMKRMLLSQYQYNSTILGFETSKFYSGTSNLSPIGKLQTDMQEFVKKYPKPGPQHTPIAFMQDFFSGWMTPAEKFKNKFTVWNFIPYKTSDYFTHELFDMYYNEYIQTGLHKNELGGLCNTPYGDALDVILSDARTSAMKRYQVIVVTGDIVTNLQEVSDRIKSYVNHGGHLVITYENAKKLLPSIKLTDDNSSFSVEERIKGKGKITVIYSPNMGLDKNNELAENVRKELDKIFKSTVLFSVGDSLGFVTNIEGNGTYTLGIYNNNLESKSFKIESNIGEVLSIKELNPIRNLEKEEGYFPEGFGDTKPGLSDKNNIAAGDARLFQIKVEEKNVEYLKETHPEKRIVNKYLAVPSLIGLQARLQTMPTFFDYFSGVKVNWKEILEIDEFKFNENAWWYNLKQVQIAIEFDHDFYNLYKTNPEILSEIANTLSPLKHIDILLFSNDFPQNLKKEISQNYIKALSVVKSSNKIIVVNKGEVAFSENNEKPIIIDEEYIEWHDIYKVAIAMNKGEKCIVPSGNNTKQSAKQRININQKVEPENKNIYFSHHKTDKDIVDELNENPEYLMNFGGVKIDATYLLSRSIDKCKKEAELWKKVGLNVIVDFSREINNYPNLTWLAEIEHAYKRSLNIEDNVLQKMELLGINNVIIGSHMPPEHWHSKFNRTAQESVISGMKTFIQNANKRGITVSIQNRRSRSYPFRLLAKPNEVSTLVSNFNKEGMKVKYAAHLGLGEKSSKLLSIAGNDLKICVVASIGSKSYDYRIPFYESKNKEKFKIDKNVLIVFDADYKSVDELLKDKHLFIQQNIK
ncbi:MAG: hypothetical protein KAH25_00755 [Bacteroidales bacterium]|nr:hypothetical protein [Bacteroidales bacterium]